MIDVYLENDTYLLNADGNIAITSIISCYSSLLGVASCTFVRTLRLPPQSTLKSHLPAELGKNRSQLPIIT